MRTGARSSAVCNPSGIITVVGSSSRTRSQDGTMPLFQAETLQVDTDGDVALLKLDVPGRSVNVITRQVLADLDAALDRVAAQSSLRVLVLRGMKKSGFLAGADIQQFAT